MNDNRTLFYQVKRYLNKDKALQFMEPEGRLYVWTVNMGPPYMHLSAFLPLPLYDETIHSPRSCVRSMLKDLSRIESTTTEYLLNQK